MLGERVADVNQLHLIGSPYYQVADRGVESATCGALEVSEFDDSDRSIGGSAKPNSKW
jgi:hypothetical protein